MVDHPQTILVVDDEPTVRASTQRILEHAGFRVLTAADGAQGLALLEQHPGRIALVLLDLSMPGLSGEETLARLRQASPRLRVLLCSGSDLPSNIAEDDEQTGFLAKPFNSTSLLSAVRAALGSAAE